jgi:DNA-binding transcriptional LysR family regulator
MVNLPRGEADIAIRLLPKDAAPGRPTVLARKMCTLGYALYGSRDYLNARPSPPDPISSLAGYHYVAYRRKANVPGGVWLGGLSAAPEVVLRTSGIHPACRAVRAGLGLGVLPCIMGDAEDLVQLTDVIDEFNVWLVTNPEGRDHVRIQTIKTELADMIAAERALLEGGPAPSVSPPPPPRPELRPSPMLNA